MSNNVSSFRSLSAQHGSIHDVSTVNGLLLQQRMRVSRGSTFEVNVGMQPTEIVTRQTPSGQPQFLMAMPPEVFQVNYELKTPELALRMLWGRSQLMDAKFKPIEQLKFGIKLMKFPSTGVIPVAKVCAKLPRAVLDILCESRDHKSVTSIDCSLSLGTRQNAIAVQVVLRPCEAIGFASMLHHRWGSSMAALAMSHSKDVTVGCLRMKKTINDKWTVGVNWQVDSSLTSLVTLGWVGTVGRCTIHSAVNSAGLITTNFGVSITPTFKFVVTESLDHPGHAYRTGLGFSWTPKDKN